MEPMETATDATATRTATAAISEIAFIKRIEAPTTVCGSANDEPTTTSTSAAMGSTSADEPSGISPSMSADITHASTGIAEELSLVAAGNLPATEGAAISTSSFGNEEVLVPSVSNETKVESNKTNTIAAPDPIPEKILPDKLLPNKTTIVADEGIEEENTLGIQKKNESITRPNIALNVQCELIQEVVYKDSIMYRVLERIGKLKKKPTDNNKKQTHHFRIEEEDEVYGTIAEPKLEKSVGTKSKVKKGKKRQRLVTTPAHRQLINMWPAVFPQEHIFDARKGNQHRRRQVRVINGPYVGECGTIIHVIDGRFSLIESEVGGSFMTVNNFHLQPILDSTENDRATLRKKSFQSSNITTTTLPTTPNSSITALTVGTSTDQNNRTDNKRKKSPPK